MLKKLGRPIDKATAEMEINKFLEIREHTYESLLASVRSGSSTSIQYYTEKENSFVFEIDELKNLIEKSSHEGGNGIRVYYAASPKDETIDGMNRKAGSTTIVLIPCTIQKDKTGYITSISNIKYSDDEAGIEYPGGLTGSENLTERCSLYPDKTEAIGIALIP